MTGPELRARIASATFGVSALMLVGAALLGAHNLSTNPPPAYVSHSQKGVLSTPPALLPSGPVDPVAAVRVVPGASVRPTSPGGSVVGVTGGSAAPAPAVNQTPPPVGGSGPGPGSDDASAEPGAEPSQLDHHGGSSPTPSRTPASTPTPTHSSGGKGPAGSRV